MALSLALISAGLFVCYLLWGVHPVPGQTLNAVLAGSVFAGWPMGGLIAFVTILAEGALLFVAAQTGFIDGPRVMANMANDSWLPRRFALLSERLTMNNGILIMGIASLLLLIYSRGSIDFLITMYAINVFITFSLSQFGMARFVYKNRRTEPKWKTQSPDFHGRVFTLRDDSLDYGFRENRRRGLADDSHYDACGKHLLPYPQPLPGSG